MGARDKEFTLEDVQAELKKIGDAVKEEGTKALAEADKAGKLSIETKAKLDELLLAQGELQQRQLEIEQKMARRGEQDDKTPRTPGQAVVESESFKQFIANGGMRMQNSSCVITLPRAAIESTDTTNTTTVGVPADLRPGVIPGTERRLTVRDLITPGRTTSNAIQYVKETGFTNAAAPVSETNRKPESTLTYALTQTPVITLAHFIKAAKQILDDFAQLQSMIDGRLRYGLKLVEENQLLKGSGVGINLNGIYTQATAYAAPVAIPSPETKIDRIRWMLLQAELAEYPATGIVLNPIDWALIEILKDGEDRYIIGMPQGNLAARLWNRPVVATQAMTVDTALVGAFQLGAQIFDREEANVVIATQNEADFVENLITIRCEERLALAVYRPEAFIKDTNLPA